MDRPTMLRIILECIDRHSPIPVTPAQLATQPELAMLAVAAADVAKLCVELEQRGYLANRANPVNPIYKGITATAIDQLQQSARELDPAIWGAIAY